MENDRSKFKMNYETIVLVNDILIKYTDIS